MNGNDQILISVIIPVYNVVTVLPTCLDSILSQNLVRQVEVILVDDGSTDGSGKICDAYQERHGGIKVIHTDNGGPSKARNLGISKAKGKYITFIDSDDTIEKDYFSRLWEASNLGRLDIVFSEICDIDWKNNRKKRHFSLNLTGDLRQDWFGLYKYSQGPCGKLYRRNIIVFNNLSFPENILSGEDQIFNLLFFRCAKNCGFAQGSVYNYYHRNNGSLSYRKEKIMFDSNMIKLEYENNILNERNHLNNMIINNSVLRWVGSFAEDSYQPYSYPSFDYRVRKLRPYLRFDSINDVEGKKRRVLFLLLKYKMYILVYLFFVVKRILTK